MGFLDYLNPFTSLAKSLESVTNNYVNAKTEQARLAKEAATDKEKIAADERVKVLSVQQRTLIERWKAPKKPMEGVLITLLTIPAVYYIWRLVLIDKLFGLRTDPISEEMWVYIFMVLTYWFGVLVADRFMGKKK